MKDRIEKLPDEGMVNGFTFNSYTREVLHSISSSVGHGLLSLSHSQCENTTSQRPMKQFSTKVLAAKALRHEMEMRFAKQLMKVDEMIQQFQGESQ